MKKKTHTIELQNDWEVVKNETMGVIFNILKKEKKKLARMTSFVRSSAKLSSWWFHLVMEVKEILFLISHLKQITDYYKFRSCILIMS